jgi:hypothetical protein
VGAPGSESRPRAAQSEVRVVVLRVRLQVQVEVHSLSFKFKLKTTSSSSSDSESCCSSWDSLPVAPSRSSGFNVTSRMHRCQWPMMMRLRLGLGVRRRSHWHDPRSDSELVVVALGSTSLRDSLLWGGNSGVIPGGGVGRSVLVQAQTKMVGRDGCKAKKGDSLRWSSGCTHPMCGAATL